MDYSALTERYTSIADLKVGMFGDWKIKAMVVRIEEEKQFKSGLGSLRSILL